ncbi:hypothetical protein ACOMHN_011634 [Nucella lapillus]
MMRVVEQRAIEEMVTPEKLFKHRSKTLAHRTDSDMLRSMRAVSETVLVEKEVLVHPVVREAYRRMLEYKALPNSTLKRLPKAIPRPSPTWNELMNQRVLDFIMQYYGPEKPRPHYPILPPRQRPPPPPEPEPKDTKGKKKKGKHKKGRKKQHSAKPEEPFCMTKWRKKNLPVASTSMSRHWFKPRLCFQPTPPLSQPPSPPGEVPESDSYFGYFVNNLGPDYLKKHINPDYRKSFISSSAASSRRHLGDVLLSPSSVRDAASLSHSLVVVDNRSTGQVFFAGSDHSSRKDLFLSVG